MIIKKERPISHTQRARDKAAAKLLAKQPKAKPMTKKAAHIQLMESLKVGREAKKKADDEFHRVRDRHILMVRAALEAGTDITEADFPDAEDREKYDEWIVLYAKDTPAAGRLIIK